VAEGDSIPRGPCGSKKCLVLKNVYTVVAAKGERERDTHMWINPFSYLLRMASFILKQPVETRPQGCVVLGSNEFS
jgi:hypothetical protein